ncbi:hypothetical protein [Caldicellulosiruptor naganoensis]|uniref:Uncharacterized protein n=1 Tax=Caldicellulosiruptor naganoensis TaxID=29324 RepID=A0ABY7BIJ6_9FIRM|nr:hypothetical protein [Caldicellulosiruptor naganoensis]WAM32233.1 hypothetical protein OTJ99_000752 [Caldicellulosiruptor naganoensis]
MKKGLELSVFSPQRQRKLRNFGLFCIFPDDIEINSIKVEGDCAKIDLNSKFYQKKYLDFYVKAIAFFITSFDNIKRGLIFTKMEHLTIRLHFCDDHMTS